MKQSRSLANLQQHMRCHAAPKRLPGRPRLSIPVGVVFQLARVGFAHREIAVALGCSVKTLRRRFRDELRLGRTLISGKVKIVLVGRALNQGDQRALLLLARRLKWDI